MSNYAKLTDFAIKDTLATGDADKRVRGSEIDAEFEALETAIATKADLASPALTGNPTAPTQTAGNNTTRLATTAFVTTAISNAQTTFQTTWRTDIASAVNDQLPVYSIIMWYGTIGTAPSNWQECDGTNGTPDLRGKFPLGVSGTYAKGATGGSADAIAVAHTHSFSGTTSSDGAHTHTFNVYSGPTNPYVRAGNQNCDTFIGTDTTSSSGAHTHTVSGTTGSSGSSGTGANMPPYHAVYYIMKLTNYSF